MLIGDPERDFIRKNISKYSFVEFSDMLNCKRKSIVQHISKSYDMEDYPNLFEVVSEGFVNFENRESIYILGLLWADGHVSKADSGIKIQNSRVDLEEITHIFEKTGEWTYSESPHTKKGKPLSSFYTFNKPLHKFLVENDYSEKSRKSPCRILSNIPESLVHYFYRGWLDGDGTIDVDRVAYCSSYEQDWSCFDPLSKKLFFDFNIYKRESERGGKIQKSSTLNITSMGGMKRFFNFIYNGYQEDEIGLTRKYQSYIKFLDKINRQYNKTGYRGVGKTKSGYRCIYRLGNDQIFKGGFSLPEEAAKHYDEGIVKRDGLSANTNFPIENYLDILKESGYIN